MYHVVNDSLNPVSLNEKKSQDQWQFTIKKLSICCVTLVIATCLSDNLTLSLSVKFSCRTSKTHFQPHELKMLLVL